MRVVVDRSRCVGTGICESTVPDVFEIEDDGRLVIEECDVAPDRLDPVRAAVASCPTQALSLIESER
jgi:ferredoxin